MPIRGYTLPDREVASAGTPVQLVSEEFYVYSVIINAPISNTGNVYVGDADVADDQCFAALTPGGVFTMNGIELGALENLDLSTIWLDADNNGATVHVGYQLMV